MIMFLVMNASGLTLIPVTIMVYRAQMGAANPADVFIPIMVTTFAATLVAVIAVCLKQGINIFNRAIIGFFGIIMAIIAGTIFVFHSMPQEKNQYRFRSCGKYHFAHHYRYFYFESNEKQNQYFRRFHRWR